MKLLLYAPAVEEAGKRLQGIIENLVPEAKREVCRTIDDLSIRLRQPMNNLSVAVLLAATRQDLSDIVTIADLMGDLRLIVILPDLEDDTIAKGHSLRPRFLDNIDSDFSDIAAILGKMLKTGAFIDGCCKAHEP
ncbi:MAG: hypothetical protein AB1847_06780 [bacterium]